MGSGRGRRRGDIVRWDGDRKVLETGKWKAGDDTIRCCCYFVCYASTYFVLRELER